MQLNLRIKIFAVLVIYSANMHKSWGQTTDDFKLNLGSINTEDVQLKPTNTNEYELSITSQDARRSEIISLQPSDDASGPVVVTSGKMETHFPNENLNLVVNYVADKNGYRASYRFGKGLKEDLDISFGPRLSIKDLMSLAG